MSNFKNLLLILMLISVVKINIAQQSALYADNTKKIESGETDKTLKMGRITGQVIDAKTNETLIGVTIIVGDKKFVTTTDIDGKYELKNIPPGVYNIYYSFISYSTKSVEQLKVKQGETVNMDIKLEESFSELGEIVIVAKRETQTVNSILAIQKENITIADGISAEAIKKSADGNTGAVIKRVSGATIQDNKFAVIRGLSDRYNIAMLNGSPLPSTEPDRRAFSFDLFPSALLDNMMITKTASPDLPGEFSGGVIMLNTKDIPDKNFFSFSVGTSYNATYTFKDFYHY